MNLFANATLVNVRGATTAKSPAERFKQLINEQLEMLEGKTVLGTTKKPKKSWVKTVKIRGEGTKLVLEPRISNRAILNGQAVLCANEEEAKGWITSLHDWQKDPNLKKTVEDIYEEISKPKKRKS